MSVSEEEVGELAVALREWIGGYNMLPSSKMLARFALEFIDKRTEDIVGHLKAELHTAWERGYGQGYSDCVWQKGHNCGPEHNPYPKGGA